MGRLRIRHGLVFSDLPWTCLGIRHKRLRPVPPCGLQQLGRPVWRIRHTTPDGPPWLADLGLRRWYTYLVYPQHVLPRLSSPLPVSPLPSPPAGAVGHCPQAAMAAPAAPSSTQRR
jgi:hypothetical protein